MFKVGTLKFMLTHVYFISVQAYLCTFFILKNMENQELWGINLDSLLNMRLY